LSAGLDPTLGALHADQRNRDSFGPAAALVPIVKKLYGLILPRR
jgi:hypothetical protein